MSTSYISIDGHFSIKYIKYFLSKPVWIKYNGKTSQVCFWNICCSSMCSCIFICMCLFIQPRNTTLHKTVSTKSILLLVIFCVVSMHTFFKTQFRCEHRFLQDIIWIQVGIEIALGFLHMFQNCVLQMKSCRRNGVEFHL